MARITLRKLQEAKLSEVFTLYLASAAARGVKDKTPELTNNTSGQFPRDWMWMVTSSNNFQRP